MAWPQIWKPRCSPATKHLTARHSIMVPSMSSKSALGLHYPSAGSSNSQAKQLFSHFFTLCFLPSLPFTLQSAFRHPHLLETHIPTSSHAHLVLVLYWGQGEKWKGSRNADWVISTCSLQNVSLWANNSTPGGDLPQTNDYLRISHTAVPKAYDWLCRKDYCSNDEYR